MISGELLSLRTVEPEDLRTLMDWRNSPECKKNFREYREINSDMQEAWYRKTVLNDSSTIMLSIISRNSGELMGCCGLCYINWIHRHADLSVYIGWNNLYIDKDGYAEEACNLLFDYGFRELNLNKIYAEAYEFDSKKLALLKKLGLKQDGRFREHHYFDGRYWDSFIFSRLKNEHLKYF